MKQLRKVLTQTTWANASDAINKNSDRIYEAITRVENATTKNKGYFETSNALLDTYPNPSVGDIAFVFNLANNIDTPYDVYKAEFSSTTNKYEWYDSGINAPFADVDINSVNDSIIDIEQQVDTLKDPRLPIICDANGRLGLNVGNGLYVDSNGDLCATQSIGGGGSGSGGETYYAAGGISINEDNFISVKKDASLEFDNDNALRVGTGEGLVHNSSGKLSVNVGKGLVINDKTNTVEVEGYDAIKELPIAIQKKQDRLIKGSGIDITSENIINVDGSNLQVLLSTNAINDEDGNRIRATYAKKEEVGGIYEAIEATNTTVASHTQSIESLELNKQDNLDFGNGLSTVGNLVKVEDAVLKDIADNKKNIDTLSSSISVKQDKLTASDGINLEDGKLSVHIGTGLDFDPESSAVVVKVGAGVKTDINQSLTIKHDTTLTTDAEGQLGVNQGTITSIAASEVAKVVANAPANYDTLKEIADYIATDAEGAAQLSNRIGALESELPNKMDAVAFGSGLAFSGNVVKVADTVMADIANNKSNIGKLQSSVDGLSTSKQDTISDLETIRNNASNGATAYGWGNHGIAGYAKKAKVNGHVYEADADTIINLPAYPTSLPANGGNADTLDGHDSSYFATASALDNKQDALTFGSGLSETNGTLKVDVSELASSNLDVTSDGRLAVGTNTIKNIAGNGLKANNQQLDLDTSAFAKVATSGSYNDLSNKPTIPSAVTESTVSGWGFTKNTGTYSKPSGGIPKSDLNSSVQTTLGNADTAYGWGYHGIAGYAKKVKVGDKTYEADSNAVVSLPAYPTSLPANGGNADTLSGFNIADFMHRTDVQAYLPKFVLKEIPKNVTQVGSIGWEDYQNYPYAGGLFLTLKGVSSLSTAMILFPDYAMNEPPLLYTSIDNHEWQGGYQLAYRSDIPHLSDGFSQKNDGTIAISTSYIASSIKGDGLVIDDKGLSVDSGVSNGKIMRYVSFPEDTTLIYEGFLESTYAGYGHPTDWFLKALCKWAMKTYKGNGRITLIGAAIPNISGTCILHVYSSGLSNDSGLPQYCSGQFEALDGSIVTFGSDNYNWAYDSLAKHSDIPTSLPANGGNADTLGGHDSSYFATKTELGNKQNTLAFGSGIAHSNNTIWVDGSQLNVNFANSAGSVAWSNVSGRPSFGNGFDSTNNVVQLKLSTGLAIDDRGYLYVTGL